MWSMCVYCREREETIINPDLEGKGWVGLLRGSGFVLKDKEGSGGQDRRKRYSELRE